MNRTGLASNEATVLTCSVLCPADEIAQQQLNWSSVLKLYLLWNYQHFGVLAQSKKFIWTWFGFEDLFCIHPDAWEAVTVLLETCYSMTHCICSKSERKLNFLSEPASSPHLFNVACSSDMSSCFYQFFSPCRNIILKDSFWVSVCEVTLDLML